METYMLYYNAMKTGNHALTVNMVSDCLYTDTYKDMTSEERVTSIDQLAKVTLESLL